MGPAALDTTRGRAAGVWDTFAGREVWAEGELLNSKGAA